jgi:hypothetical protein
LGEAGDLVAKFPGEGGQLLPSLIATVDRNPPEDFMAIDLTKLTHSELVQRFAQHVLL